MIGRQNKMFNMMLGASKRCNNLATRAFSTQVATVGADSSSHTADPRKIQTLWQYSNILAKENAAKVESEAAYLDTLKSFSTVPGAYTKMSETGSSKHLTSIKKRINKIVQ